MTSRIAKTLRAVYNKTINSIAFYPALIAIGFLILSWLMLELDFSETGKHIKSNYSWVRLKDASTARTIVSTIAGGIISLMVFSFSMVMILLNQAASQMSNRMLESMIGNRFQQLVLGFYIGTIVYALFLLSTIRDIESGIYVPALSIYLLLVVTIADIFVFIYFLHYVTQSVKFETIISRVHKQTFNALKKACTVTAFSDKNIPSSGEQIIETSSSAYYQGFDQKQLLDAASQRNGSIKLLHPPGTFLLKGQPVAIFYSEVPLKKEDKEELLLALDFYTGQSINQNYYYGFHQLTEVALKALSPGINDPQTAVLSIHALSDLFQYRLKHYPKTEIDDKDGKVYIYLTERGFDELFRECILPIWDYGCDDRYIQQTLKSMTVQLLDGNPNDHQVQVLTAMLSRINEKTINKD
ncbi:DUF2254 domain-containing protein [Mucilaginibacter sp. UR6-1]|uniref:DUF2254 domain-containing protein n=1 Tax=Mucilaginibacter sp. UR6-1 TaxID=1435643 RepID=UPI001E2F49B3|nr:DUF2254 domain-containing protein [Mucilaginibacter sp. UR6-1]MCC8410773.1 DUF2254 domain-containing protein [Mucilaginibacter sp. UR6-1]